MTSVRGARAFAPNGFPTRWRFLPFDASRIGGSRSTSPLSAAFRRRLSLTPHRESVRSRRVRTPTPRGAQGALLNITQGRAIELTDLQYLPYCIVDVRSVRGRNFDNPVVSPL